MVSKLQLIMFSVFFLMFTTYISALAGIDIVSGVDYENIPTLTASDLINPFTVFSYFFWLVSISTEYKILSVLIFSPLTISLIYAILEWARGI